MSPPPPAGGLPLSRFEWVHTVDADQARQVVAEAFCPHRFTVLDGGRGFETRLHVAGTGDVSLCYLDYGSRVHLEPEEQESFYAVAIPLVGGADLTCGREQFQYDPSGAAVTSADRQWNGYVSAGTAHLVVRIERRRLEEHFRSLLARPVAEPVRFAFGMDMTTAPARSWRRAVDLLLAEAEVDGPVLAQPLARRELERLLLTQLLLAQPSNYSALLHGEPRATAPAAIRRAADLIHDHAAEPLTVEDIAEATGISVRTLQEGFRRYLDTTPMSYLREVRLRRAREELAAADPAVTTVTGTAIRWGFLHPSRFSAQYRQRYGEPPSATLRH